MLFRRSKSLVGLDIGSSSVKAIELKPAGKGFRVTALGVESVPPDSIVDGAIIDGGAVADAVRRLFANKKFKAKDVVASLSGNSVIVKKITLPVMTETELDESIYWEAEQYIPFDIQDVNLDYQILDPGTGAAHVFEQVFVDDSTPVGWQATTLLTSLQAREYVERTPAAFAYMDLAFTGPVHPIAYEGVSCTGATIKDGSYPASRPIGVVTAGRPKPALRRFLQWARTDRTARRVIATRYIPVS